MQFRVYSEYYFGSTAPWVWVAEPSGFGVSERAAVELVVAASGVDLVAFVALAAVQLAVVVVDLVSVVVDLVAYKEPHPCYP